MELDRLREEIDEIDAKLICLFEKRMDVAAKIADYKIRNGLAVLDSARENRKIEALKRICREDMAEYVSALYFEIFRLSREHQTRLMEKNNG